VGYGRGGLLTEPVKQRPHCLLVLEDAAAAHPEVGQLLVQLLEEGSLRDGAGRSVCFRNATIIFTHTLAPARQAGHGAAQPGWTPQVRQGVGEQQAQQQVVAQQQVAVAGQRGFHSSAASASGAHHHGSGTGSSGMALSSGMELHSQQQQQQQQQQEEEEVAAAGSSYHTDHPAASRQLLQDLATRVGAVVHFRALGQDQLLRVLDMHLEAAADVAAAMGYGLSVAPELKQWLLKQAAAAGAGARPLQQLVRQHVVLPMADRLLEPEMLAAGAGGWVAAGQGAAGASGGGSSGGAVGGDGSGSRKQVLAALHVAQGVPSPVISLLA
jgi:ATP-dependent Clp protease ATP-binding subunit ClpA